MLNLKRNNVRFSNRLQNISHRALLGAVITLSMSSAHASTDWSGGFWGVGLGAGMNLSDSGTLDFRRADGTDNSAAITSAFGENFDGKFEAGSTLGFRLGYNMQQENLVYGVVADLSYADLAEEQSAFSATPATYIERREVSTLATLQGRIGLASDLPVLPYLTLGLGYGDVKYSWEGNSGAYRGDNGEDGDGIGYVAGVGADYKLTDNTSIGVEFLHYNLGDSGFETRLSGEAGGALAAFGNAASGGTIQEGSEEDLTFQTLKLNVNWAF